MYGEVPNLSEVRSLALNARGVRPLVGAQHMDLRHVAASLLLLVTGCSLESGNVESDVAPAEAASTAKQTRASTAPADSAAIDEACNEEPGSDRRSQVCHAWRCEGRAGNAPASWSGDLASCNAGALDPDAGDRALRLVNMHRFLAGVAPVRAESAWSAAAQECALVAHANAKLSHTPPPDWRCWSELAARTSEVSLVANRSAPPAIAAFIEDPGNEATMVHRRWLLSEIVTRVGIGSTDHYSCVVVDGRSLAAADTTAEPMEPSPRDYVAWPPAGPVPIDVFTSERLDEVGWTIQSSSDDLDAATVTITSGGTKLAIETTHLTPLLGSRSALKIVPSGWRTEAGTAYVVTVAGRHPFEYTVEPTSCS